MKSYYILAIEDEGGPVLHGPYTTWEERDDRAILLRADDPGLSLLFPMELDVETTGFGFRKLHDHSLKVDTFGAGFFGINYATAGGTP